MLLLLGSLTVAQAAPHLDCRLPDALDALRGVHVDRVDGSVRQPRPGPGLFPVDAPPPPDGKPVYGTAYDYAIESENFVVTWWDGSVDRATAELTSAVMEDTWQALVVEQGWPAPDSSDDYLLWVVLDRTLSGTGITYEYYSDAYPNGYPAVYVNPDYAWDEAFYRNLVAHEFVHTLQYGMRDYTETGGESWYWEASAQWGAERAAPAVDGHLDSSAYYADRPWYRFDSMDDSHQYGMFVLNAYLEEVAGDDDTMRQVWLEGAGRAGQTWDVVLEAATGLPPADIWGGFTAAYANDALAESSGYADVLVDGSLTDGQAGAVAYLGTDYFEATSDHTLTVGSPDGHDVIVSSPQGWGTSVQVRAGDRVGVIGLEDRTAASYVLTLGDPEEPVEDPDDTGDTDDTDAGTPGTGDTSDDAVAEPEATEGTGTDKSGCMVVSGAGSWAAVGVGLMVVARRRRSGHH